MRKKVGLPPAEEPGGRPLFSMISPGRKWQNPWMDFSPEEFTGRNLPALIWRQMCMRTGWNTRGCRR
jgi:hypothetical protein